MDRKEFLSLIGVSAASVALINCVGCSKSSTGPSSTSGPSGVNFTLDLSASANASLLANGGYLVSNGVLSGPYFGRGIYCRPAILYASGLSFSLSGVKPSFLLQ